jgi:L-alanine-DL-glutamate epimerase-like enolase superfamily enzyme
MMISLAPDESTLARIEVFVLEDNAPPAVRSSFGSVQQRTSLLVRVTNRQGQHGWGEIWSGYPALGAYHRALLLEKIVAPLALGRDVSDPCAFMAALEKPLRTVVRLAGEPGPVSHVLAGLDCAIWDMAARVRGVPLWRLLGGVARPLNVYASGVAPQITDRDLDALRERGFRAFKFKAGFAERESLDALASLAGRLHPGESMMIDANCGWEPDSALAALAHIEGLPLAWVEEPIGPECPPEEWQALKAASSHPLAGGENLLTLAAFRAAFAWLDVVQPDLGKWGGVSRVLPLAREIIGAGLRYCPHAFGSHIGAAVAAHVLCAAGGSGVLELDANANPLRTLGSTPFPAPANGAIVLGDAPGIGVDADLESLKPYLAHQAMAELRA